MPAARLPHDEPFRVAALRSYEILDTERDASFDNVVSLAADLADCPMALVSLIDGDRQWCKATYGLDATETPRAVSFCAHAILEPGEPLVVPDATLDGRFNDNPLVTGAPHIRSYLGVPLVTPEGHALGTLCVVGQAPRRYSAATVARIRGLAQTVAVSLELHRALVRMTKVALTDPLTGLPNRRALVDALTGMLKSHVPVATLALDLDHFKEANDVHGHAAGDALLKAVAERLRALLRPGDIAGRLGGDEFVVFLRDVRSEADALGVAERLRTVLHQPVIHNGTPLKLGATMGLALAPIAARTSNALLRVADEAMMRAKRQGRGSIGSATADDTCRIERETGVLAALRQVLDGKPRGLTAHLQPIICALTGRVHAVEALARWEDPVLGQVTPDEMFAVATRSGLQVELSAQVRGVALGAFARLRRQGSPVGRLALNLSAAELLGEQVVDRLESQVEVAGLDMYNLSIEITEDALLDRVAHRTLERLADMRGRGAKLGLDDFGTGTSGLAQLLQLPLDEIKLDRTFAQRLGTDGRAERIVEGTVRLAENMRLTVVAEGVETAGQARVLSALGCKLLQGWLFAPALSETALRDWLQAREAPAIAAPLQLAD